MAKLAIFYRANPICRPYLKIRALQDLTAFSSRSWGWQKTWRRSYSRTCILVTDDQGDFFAARSSCFL